MLWVYSCISPCLDVYLKRSLNQRGKMYVASAKQKMSKHLSGQDERICIITACGITRCTVPTLKKPARGPDIIACKCLFDPLVTIGQVIAPEVTGNDKRHYTVTVWVAFPAEKITFPSLYSTSHSRNGSLILEASRSSGTNSNSFHASMVSMGHTV